MRKRFVIAVVSVGVACAVFAESPYLLSDGTYVIRRPENPKLWETTAVNELREYLARRTAGGKVTVGGNGSVTFHVGDTPFAAEKGLSSASMKEEEWKIRSFGRDVVLNGGGYRGCLYAVYHFLEDFCGVRWWSEWEEDVPAPGDLALPRLDSSGKPYFMQRTIFREYTDLQSPRHAARRRVNSNGITKIPAEFGGEMGYGPPHVSHTFEMYVPWQKYGKEHPEYFALHGGKRTDSVATQQLCISNPDVRRLLLEGLLASIEKGNARAAAAGGPPPAMFDFSFNDNDNFCECPECAAGVAKYGQSGFYLNFVNYVAGKVAERYPGVLLSANAYGFTVDPPKGGVRAGANVMVKLGNLDENFAGAMDEPGKNAEIVDRLRKWRDSAQKFAVHDYAITYGIDSMGYPLPNEWYFGDKYRLFADNKVCGVQWEQEWTKTADMFELKNYLLSKLGEDPYLDYPALMKKSYSEYFGPKAAPLVLAARARVKEAQLRNKAFVGWMPTMRQFDFLTDEDLQYMGTQFDKAEALSAGNAVRLRRLKKARSGLDRLVSRRARLFVPGELDGKACWFSNPDVFGHQHRKRAYLVDDKSAPLGQALELEIRPGQISPVPVIYYDEATRKAPFKGELVIPDGTRGYAWYDLGRITVMERASVLMGSTYLAQMHTPQGDFIGKTFDVKVCAALSEKGAVRIGRVAFFNVSSNERR